MSSCTNGDTNVYRVMKNLQGDVIGLAKVNSDGSASVVCRYTYTAFGELLSVVDAYGDPITDPTHIAFVNPLRYRGYYYDDETGFYYVSSRYYDPEIGRWISPEPNVDYGEFDEGAGLLGYNVYAYCANNPVMFKDETGESITLACVLIFAGIGLIVGAVGGNHYAKHKKTLTPDDGWDYWKYVVGFGVAGGAVGALVGWGVGGVVSSTIAKSASTALFAGRVAKNGTMVIQLLQKFYENTKDPMNVKQVKQLITLCQRFGIEIHAKLGDLVNVTNHKTWNGIPHIHVGNSRIHVALTKEAVKYIRKILGI